MRTQLSKLALATILYSSLLFSCTSNIEFPSPPSTENSSSSLGNLDSNSSSSFGGENGSSSSSSGSGNGSSSSSFSSGNGFSSSSFSSGDGSSSSYSDEIFTCDVIDNISTFCPGKDLCDIIWNPMQTTFEFGKNFPEAKRPGGACYYFTKVTGIHSGGGAKIKINGIDYTTSSQGTSGTTVSVDKIDNGYYVYADLSATGDPYINFNPPYIENATLQTTPSLTPACANTSKSGLMVDKGDGKNVPAEICIMWQEGLAEACASGGGAGGAGGKLCGGAVNGKIAFYLMSRSGTRIDLTNNQLGTDNPNCGATGTLGEYLCYGGIRVNVNNGTAKVDMNDCVNLSGTWYLYVKVIPGTVPEPLPDAEKITTILMPD